MRVYVNEDRTVLVTVWDDGTAHVATRPHMDAVWGPPVIAQEEPTHVL